MSVMNFSFCQKQSFYLPSEQVIILSFWKQYAEEIPQLSSGKETWITVALSSMHNPDSLHLMLRIYLQNKTFETFETRLSELITTKEDEIEKLKGAIYSYCEGECCLFNQTTLEVCSYEFLQEFISELSVRMSSIKTMQDEIINTINKYDFNIEYDCYSDYDEISITPNEVIVHISNMKRWKAYKTLLIERNVIPNGNFQGKITSDFLSID